MTETSRDIPNLLHYAQFVDSSTDQVSFTSIDNCVGYFHSLSLLQSLLFFLIFDIVTLPPSLFYIRLLSFPKLVTSIKETFSGEFYT